MTAEFEPQYVKQLDEILDKPLTPESIDFYAENALNQVVNLVDDYTDNYAGLTHLQYATRLETETAATEHWGLRDIGEILDHLAEMSQRISKISEVIGRAVCRNNVITPPNINKTTIFEKNGEFKNKDILSRLKTTLFVLQNDFDVDIHNNEELEVHYGELPNNMMRGESYYALKVPKLERIILVCDEEGNASFIFDTRELDRLGLTTDDIMNNSKEMHSELLNKHASVGQRLVYSNSFTLRIKEAITSPSSEIHYAKNDNKLAELTQCENPTYLYPVAPEGILSLFGISKYLGVTRESVRKIIEDKADEFAPVGQYKFGPNVTYGYDISIIKKIRDQLERNGTYKGATNEEVKSLVTFSKSTTLSESVINKAIISIGDELGEVDQYRFGSRLGRGLTTEQQTMILDYLKSSGFIKDNAPEGIASASDLAKSLGLDPGSIWHSVKALGDELGDIFSYRFADTKKRAVGFTVEQQEKILEHLEGRGMLLESLPKNYVTVEKFAKRNNIARETLVCILEKLSEEIGDIELRKIGSGSAPTVNENQQMILTRYLEEQGMLVEAAPDGVVSAEGLARSLGLAGQVGLKYVSEPDDELGKLTIYRFKSKRKVGLNPDQQLIVKARIIADGWLNEPPEGTLTLNSLSKRTGIAPQTISKVLLKLGDSLGEISTFNFGVGVGRAYGYTPDQQTLIIDNSPKSKSTII